MKKLLILTLALGLSAPAFAESPYDGSLGTISAVVSSDAAASIVRRVAAEGFVDLIKIEKTATMRCPGCFEYTLTLRQHIFGGAIDLQKKVRTRKGSNQDISVTAVQ